MNLYKLFGKEPALWMGLFSACVMFFSSFVLPLSVDEQGALNAAVAALFGLLTAWSVASDGLQAAILGFCKAIIAIGISFGWGLPPEKQGVIMAFIAALSAMFVKTQVVAPVSPEGHVRDHMEVRRLSLKKAGGG